MANMSASNLTNISQPLTNITLDGEANDATLEVSYIITIIFNSITCPFTVLLNVLVIMAVKRRPRLQSYPNILLACLAVTDALTGLLVQPSFILWKIFQLLGDIDAHFIPVLHGFFIVAVSISSALHLMLVTCERLIALKYTMKYPYLVTATKIKVTVTAFWVLAWCCSILRSKLGNLLIEGSEKIGDVVVSIVLVSCIVFIATSYAILYHETALQRKKIKTQQLPQEEVERFAKESKALRTTVYVVGAVAVCFLPMTFIFLNFVADLNIAYPKPWIRTFVMLNSLLNPLIYCWRQKEMRQFMFRISSTAVGVVN